MKLNCNIVDDLLPLYLEDICSGDSKAALEEHIQDCPACGEKMARMRDGRIHPDEKTQESKFPIVSYARKVKRHRIRVGISVVLISAVGACLLSLCVLTIFFFRVEGKKITGVTAINETCEVEIIKHDLLDDGTPQEYVLDAAQIEELKQLLMESTFTRRLSFLNNGSHESVSYSIYIFFNERQEVLSLDCLGGDIMLVSGSFEERDIYDLKINNKAWKTTLESIIQSASLKST